MKTRILLALLLATSSLFAADKPPRIVVNGPLIIAFFAPMPNLSEEDENEVLSDFQLYARQVRDPLKQRGIEFQELYVGKFTIVNGKAVTAFNPTRTQVGYYLIAPGRKPRVEYGVMTDVDLLQIADEYFGRPSK